MKSALPRAIMALAVCCLGEHRREWAQAMRGEFDAAVQDGNGLRFAAGCLFGAWRQMPADEEGRFALANYVLVIGLIVPVAALLLSELVAEMPGLQPLPSGSAAGPLLTDGNRSAVPSLAVLVLLLIVSHLRIAWALLERDWGRVADTARLTASATLTLALFSGLVFQSGTGLAHAAMVLVELMAIAVLAQWHDELGPGASSAAVLRAG